MSYDGITLNPGVGGDTMAIDNIGSSGFQRVKVGHGLEGVFLDVSDHDPLPIRGGAFATDAFGHFRVSEPVTIFDLKTLHDKNPIYWNENIKDVSGNATSTFASGNAGITMYVENGDRIIRQTKTHWNYEPGASQKMLYTGVMSSGNNIRSRIGSFTDQEGLFFEIDHHIPYVVKRKEGVDIRIAQSGWNIDTLDGNGISGFDIDFSMGHIFFIDFQWLSIGRVRFGFGHEGRITGAHEMIHDNSLTSPYISTPNLPVRYEIESSGDPSSMLAICCNISSEGGQ